MKRALVLLAICLWGLAISLPAHGASPARPNILLIVADDLGYGDLGCYGATKIQTPHLDQLAREGVRLTDAHAPAAVCQPTRYALLSGAYFRRAQRQGMLTLYFHEGQVTLPGLLKSAGYRTAALGKWHLGFGRSGDPDYNGELKPGPLEIGFDSFFGTPRTHNEPPFVFVEGHRVVGLDPADPIRLIAAKDTKEGWGHGISVGGAKAHAARPVERIDAILADKAVAFLQAPRVEPFFLYLAFLAPHVPIAPAPEFQGKSQAGRYGDYVQQLDACVGRVLAALESSGAAGNTLVIFTSDNGAVLHRDALEAGHRANAHLLGQKTDTWEGGHRVPFLARWPGWIPAGGQGGQLLGLNDVLATVAAAAGVPLPPGAAPDSVNQLPVLLEPARTPAVRNELLLLGTGGFALRDGDWLFLPSPGSGGMTVRHPPGAPWGQPYARLGLTTSDVDAAGQVKTDAPKRQLYHLAADPRQAVNLAVREPARADAMATRLEALLAETRPPPRRSAAAATPPRPAARDLSPSPQYLLINLSAAEPESVYARIAAELRPPAGGPVRVGVGRIFSYFGRGRERVADELREFLARCEKHDLPALVALDGEYWLEGRPDLWNWWRPEHPGYDPANRELVEWTSWDSADALKIAWLNWGRQIRVLPPANLMHPRYRAACHEEMRRLVPIVLEWVRRLPPDKRDLFVGLKVGWESSVGVNKFYYPDGNARLDRPATEDPTTGIKAAELPARGVVQIGYAAVKTAGIRDTGAITEADLAEVARRHLADLAAEAARLGVPRSHLFTHGVGWKEGELLYDAAVNEFSSPGWSFYRHAKDPLADTGVQRALARSDAPHWAAIEWLHQGPNTVEAWQSSLQRTLSAPGCRLVCIFNWRQIAEKPAALEAIRQVGAASPATAAPGLRVGPGGTVQRDGRPFRGIGVNYFDCFIRTLKDRGDTSYDAGFAALAAKGIPFARFCATGFWPKDMELYQRDRVEYFRRLDGVVRAAERHGVGLIPSLFWLLPCVPDLVGEPMDQWGEPTSRTHAWMRRYVEEVVGRYRASPAIWAWEFGNEFNLAIDLPDGATHRPKIVPALGTPTSRSERDELRLEHLEVAAREFARAVRALDPGRPVTSGHSFPRPSAWHLQAKRSWQKDDEAQFTAMLARQHPAPIDLLSVHVYREDAVGRMEWLTRAVQASGRPLFIGEFGVTSAAGTPEEQRQEFARLLAAVSATGAPLAALWVYDYSRQPEWSVTVGNARAWQLDAIAAANRSRP